MYAMKKTTQIDVSNVQDDLEVLFQEMFGRRLDNIRYHTLNKLEEINMQYGDFGKKLKKGFEDLEEKIDDLEVNLGGQHKKSAENLDSRLNIVSGKLTETKTELLKVMADNLKHLNDENIRSKEEIVALIASLSEPMARIDNLELEQEKLAKSLSVIEGGFDEIKRSLNALGVQIQTNGEQNLIRTQVLIENSKDGIVKDIARFGKELEQSSNIGFDALQNRLTAGFELSQKLADDCKNQTGTLMESYQQSLMQQNHEKALKIDKQLNRFANYGKVLLAINVISLVIVLVLMYFSLILN